MSDELMREIDSLRREDAQSDHVLLVLLAIVLAFEVIDCLVL